MRRPISALALATALALHLAPAVHAASTDEARGWLEKLAGLAGRGPYRADYSGQVLGGVAGESANVTMKGRMTFADPKHVHMSFDVTMSTPQMAPVVLSATAVSDGATMWVEMQNPMTGKQVLKAPLDKLEALRGGGPMMGLGGQSGGLDPVSQVQGLSEKFDFELVGRDAGAVTLEATLDAEALALLGQDATAAPAGRLTLVLDEKTAFPREMRIAGDTPLMIMRFDSCEFLDAATIDPGLFAYTPPDGASVIDLGAMVEAGAASATGP